MRILNIVTNEFILEKQKLEAELERCIELMKKFSMDINMHFGIEKCAQIHTKK